MRRQLVTILAIALLSAGCASSGHPATHAATTGAAFPVTIRTVDGAVTVPHRPMRIMSLSATGTSMLYAIGAGPQVVAVDKYSDDPPNAPRTKLTGYETGPESYLPYHPDLVVLAYDQSGKLVGELRTLHIAALMLPAAATLADTYQQFAELGAATGHVAAAAREIAFLRTRLDAITRAAGNAFRGKTYYHELDQTLFSATSRTFIGALYARLGLVNVADPAARSGSQYPQLSAEYLLKANPDYIFLADSVCCGQTAATFARRPGFSLLRAVRLHHVFSVPDPIASQWGPRIVEFLALVVHDLQGAPTS